MSFVTPKDLYQWCRIPYDELENHPDRKVPFRLCKDSANMGQIMAFELVEMIKEANADGRTLRAIIPCGPACWYKPFTDLVNAERVSLKNFVVFHMDECLDWQGRELPLDHPYSFRGFMEQYFYAPVDSALAVPSENRVFPSPNNIPEVEERIWAAPIAITYGGWGQDGHVAYNQARRMPYSPASLEQLRRSSRLAVSTSETSSSANSRPMAAESGTRRKGTFSSGCPSSSSAGIAHQAYSCFKSIGSPSPAPQMEERWRFLKYMSKATATSTPNTVPEPPEMEAPPRKQAAMASVS